MSAAKLREHAAGYVLLLPALLILFIFVVIPIFYSAGLSLLSWDMMRPAPTFIGLDNYVNLFQNDSFYNTLFRTLLYAVMTVPASMILALGFALLLDKGLRWVLTVYRSLFFAPIVTSTVAISVVWMFIYHPDYGLANELMKWLGFEPLRWLNDSDTALISLAIMAIWKHIGFCVIIYLAGLQGIPSDVEEAAKVDGAGLVRILFSIKLPLLTPTIFFLLIYLTIEQLQTFTQIDVMTKGGPAGSTELIVMHLWNYAFERFQMGYASAIAMVLLGIILLLTWIQMRFVGSKVHYQ
ncbi:ABC transporter permease subunit [Paenibacillus sp. LMG 31456]|uniref:ABC transporter permease subunit n=1 Tax=Paenibacillus foliorum TaxID=2654974 RepID=A0A972GY85_9BACL|nr:sugar ABC transporter permease [Paenibacillus foliorum]NOU92746.1 ABC transporter permease subunit [Paenibacillus foliorum]